MTERRKRLLIVVAIVAAQLGILVWWMTSRENSAAIEDRTPPVAAPQTIASLPVTTRDGVERDLAAVERPTLVHFWATWCPPCRDELPMLLERAADPRLDVVAVALDPTWEAVDQEPAARGSRHVALADPARARELGIDELPVTLLVLPGGQATLRVDGARDWSDDRFYAAWIAASAP